VRQFIAHLLLLACTTGLTAAESAVKPLPTALVIGDSICISGYAEPLKEMLKGKVDVKIGAALSSKITLTQIDGTLKAHLGEGKADVIHFNCGLWDMCIVSYDEATGNFYNDTLKGQRMVDPATYEKNLRELVRILKGRTDKLIWGTITPIPDPGPGRHSGDEYLYNKIAEDVMKENGVMIDDLYSFILPHLKAYGIPSDVHFNNEGKKFMAKRVADTILKALSGELKSETFKVNPDTSYTIEERGKMITYTPGAARPEIKPDPQLRGVYAYHEMQGKSLMVHSTTGWRWKLTAYDHYVLRMQIVRAGDDFPADGKSPVVKNMGQVSDLIVDDRGRDLSVRTWATDGIPLTFLRGNMGIQWLWTQGMLQDGSGIGYENTMATWEFRMGKDEQFVSLPEGVNVTGQSVSRHYKTAPDTVPAFVSSRNYGMLLNVDKRVGLNLGKNNGLKLSYHYGDQPMDLFVIVGKDREEIIQRYRKLTEH
jgi:lysophospholipase L1-like esterase